jgi:recombination associated protein RdgC
MFKNAIIYRSTFPSDNGNYPDLPEFVPCGPTQEKSMGWVPPRGQEHGAIAELVGHQTILKFVTEAKTVPADVIARKAQEQAQKYEDETGFKPGKRIMAEFKEEAKLTLLPHAFAKRSTVLVWLSPEGFITLDTTSQGKADDAITSLVGSFEGLVVRPVYPRQSPSNCMAEWLVEQEAPAGFTVDRECELKAVDDSKAVVKYGHHPLDIDEVKAHVMQGKVPTKLALTFNDRVSFVLTDNLILKKLTFLNATAVLSNQEDAFDADVVLLAGELIPLYTSLLASLGGEESV